MNTLMLPVIYIYKLVQFENSSKVTVKTLFGLVLILYTLIHYTDTIHTHMNALMLHVIYVP